MCDYFPETVGSIFLNGLSFEHVFNKSPKDVEFIKCLLKENSSLEHKVKIYMFMVKMVDSFPLNMGSSHLAGRTFEEVLHTFPKDIEFVNSLWTGDKTTGVFKDFFLYVKTQLQNPAVLHEHQARSLDFCKGKKRDELPSYMRKYLEDDINKYR